MGEDHCCPNVNVRFSRGALICRGIDFGLLRAEVEHHTIRTALADTANADLPDLQAVFDEMRDELLARARDEGCEPDVVECSGYVDLRYRGQSSEITVGLASLRLTDEALREAEATFEAEYERTYGHRGDVKAFELVNCRVVGRVVRGVAHEARWSLDEHAPGTEGVRRDAYFGPEAGLVSTPILSRGELDASVRPGPAVIRSTTRRSSCRQTGPCGATGTATSSSRSPAGSRGTERSDG